jgi:hypothetical protein
VVCSIVVSELDFVCIFQEKREEKGRSTLICTKVVSYLKSVCIFQAKGVGRRIL